MSTIGLLFILAAVGGAIVWTTIQGIPGWAPVAERAAGRLKAKAGRRNRRSAAPAGVRRAIDVFQIDETWVEPRTTMLGRLLALGRLVLFGLLICAVAGGGLMWVRFTLARMIGLSQGG